MNVIEAIFVCFNFLLEIIDLFFINLFFMFKNLNLLNMLLTAFHQYMLVCLKSSVLFANWIKSVLNNFKLLFLLELFSCNIIVIMSGLFELINLVIESNVGILQLNLKSVSLFKQILQIELKLIDLSHFIV